MSWNRNASNSISSIAINLRKKTSGHDDAVTKPNNTKEMQVGFIAINKKGQFGAYALQKGFQYAVKTDTYEKLMDSDYYYKN